MIEGEGTVDELGIVDGHVWGSRDKMSNNERRAESGIYGPNLMGEAKIIVDGHVGIMDDSIDCARQWRRRAARSVDGPK